jgi:hypothetical protein
VILPRLAHAWIVLGLLILTTSAAEAAISCEPAAAPVFSVKTEAPKVSSDQAMSRDRILAFARQRDPTAGKDYDGILGITDTEIDRNIRFEFRIAQSPGGVTCVSVTSIAVTVLWKSAVHVASELKPGSCMYGVVETHEQGHVEINRQGMGYGQGLIERALRTIKVQAVAAATPDEGVQRLKRSVSATLQAAGKRLDAEMARRQKAHDTPEEYAKGAKICGAEENNRALGQ